MKKSNRAKRRKLRTMVEVDRARARYRKYACSCGRHNMAEKSEWDKFLATPVGKEWMLAEVYGSDEDYPDDEVG